MQQSLVAKLPLKPDTTCIVSDFVSISVIRLASLITQHADILLRKNCDLTHAQFAVLMILQCAGSSSQTHIAQQLKLTTAAVSRLTDILEGKQLLKRSFNPQNRRENILKLTKIGQQRVIKAIKLIKHAEHDLFGSHPDNSIFFDRVANLAAHLQKHITV